MSIAPDGSIISVRDKFNLNSEAEGAAESDAGGAADAAAAGDSEGAVGDVENVVNDILDNLGDLGLRSWVPKSQMVLPGHPMTGSRRFWISYASDDQWKKPLRSSRAINGTVTMSSNSGRLMCRAALKAFQRGDLPSSALTLWANAIEGRDDVSFNDDDAAVLSQILFEVSTPEINGAVTLERVLNWERQLQDVRVTNRKSELEYQPSAGPNQLMSTFRHAVLLVTCATSQQVGTNAAKINDSRS